MSGRSSGFILVASLLAAACGKAVVPPSGDPDAGDDDGGTDPDAAPEPDAADPDGGDPPAPKGIIHAFSRSFTNEAGVPVQNGSISARFGDIELNECAIDLTEGDCSVLTCRPREPATPPPEAGTIDLFVDGVLLTNLAPSRDGTYAPYEKPDLALFASGVLLTASTKGDTVPAFEVEITTPTPIAFDGNVPSGVTAIDISVGGTYNLRWAPGADSDKVLLAMASPPDGDGVFKTLDCRVPSSVGDFTVPAAILASMPIGPALFETRVESESTSTIGTYDITLAGAVVAIDGPTGNWARGGVNLVP
jgi:hypothetical protein